MGTAPIESRVRAPVRGSSEVTVPAALFAIHSRPPAKEIRSGSGPDASLRSHAQVALVERVHDPVGHDRNPDAPTSDRDVADRGVQVDLRQLAAGLGVELPEHAGILERPERSVAKGDSAAAVVRDVPPGEAVSGNDPGNLPLLRYEQRPLRRR